MTTCNTCGDKKTVVVVLPNNGGAREIECPDCPEDNHPITKLTGRLFSGVDKFLDDIGVPPHDDKKE